MTDQRKDEIDKFTKAWLSNPTYAYWQFLKWKYNNDKE